VDKDDNLKEFAEYLRTLGDVRVQSLWDPQEPIGDHRIEALLVPEGYKAQSIKPYLDDFLKRPRRRKGTATVTDLDSFVTLTARGADGHSVIFAARDKNPPTLTAVLNYNEPTADDAAARGRFGDHRVLYNFPLSPEWTAWIGQNGKSMSQGEFAAFVEGRVLDLVEQPTKKDEPVMLLAKNLRGTFALPSEMVTMSRGMSLNVNEQVQEVIDIGSGQMQVNYSQTHVGERGKPLKVPSLFLIAVPVFQKGELFLIAARLRYRKTDARLIWWYELYQPEKSFDLAFDEAAEHAAEETKLPLYYGTPEA
jgi:uncharacterized protein YfdQ (DUF2303 family)